MKFYDYLVTAHPAEVIRKAEELGWSGICIAGRGPAPEGKAGHGIDLPKTLLIEPANADVLRKTARKERKRYEIFCVRCMDDNMCRAAAETPEADIMIPEGCAGIGYVTARLAKKNGVAIGFEFRQLLDSPPGRRGAVFSVMLQNARLARRFRAPFALVSGASSVWDLRAPAELAAFGRVLGLRQPDISHCLSGSKVEGNRKRLGGKWVMPGVEIE